MLSRLPNPPLRGAPGALSAVLMVVVAAVLLGQPTRVIVITAAISIGIWQFLETNAINGEQRALASRPHGSRFSAELLEFYAECVRIQTLVADADSNQKVEDSFDMANAWYAKVQQWIGANMGAPALAAFLDKAGHNDFVVTGSPNLDQEHRNSRNAAANVLRVSSRNLRAIISTPMYDPR